MTLISFLVKNLKIILNRVKYYEKLIKTDNQWLNSVKEKARKLNVPIEVAIYNDSIYMVEQEKKK